MERLANASVSANGKATGNGFATPLDRATTVASWAVGVTTAPRRNPTLERTLLSLAAAGWDRPRLFVEPGTQIPARFADLPRTQRDEPLGAFSSWYLALTELVMRHPRAEAYFLVQDDVVFARGVRRFLERALWPAPDCGAVSVYCPSNYAVGLPPGFHAEDRGWKTWTAQALLFPNPSARALIGDLEVVNHRHHGRRGGQRNIDCVVGRWCRTSGRPFYVYTPSLAQHVGETSTLYAGAGVTGIRGSTTFIGEQADAAELPVIPVEALPEHAASLVPRPSIPEPTLPDPRFPRAAARGFTDARS